MDARTQTATTLAALLVGSSLGCGNAVDGGELEMEDVAAAAAGLYVQTATLFPRIHVGRPDGIEVCFENSNFPTERQWVRSSIDATWGKAGAVRFQGWGICPPSTFKGIRVALTSTGGAQGGIGAINGVQGVKFSVFPTFPSCQGAGRESCVRAMAIHEFGHALSFHHEYERPTAPANCGGHAQLPGTNMIGDYDPASVMMGANVCATRPFATTLSAGDIQGFRQMYGGPGFKLGFTRPSGANLLWSLDLDGNGVFNLFLDRLRPFGAAGDIPVAGAWGSSTGNYVSRVGSFRNGTWFLDWNGNGWWDGAVTDRQFQFGGPGHIPVPGRYLRFVFSYPAVIATFENGFWNIDMNGNGAWDPGSDLRSEFISFFAGDEPVVGAWTGSNIDKVGIFNGGSWLLDLNGNYVWDSGDNFFFFDPVGAGSPVVGDWNDDGKSEIGIFHNGSWFLDWNGNFIWEPGVDKTFTFGLAGDRPLAGLW